MSKQHTEDNETQHTVYNTDYYKLQIDKVELIYCWFDIFKNL